VLQDGEFERLGGRRTLRVDVRVVAATNRNLEKEVEAKRFREDLFYRLNVIAIDLPPLRERRGEVDLLAEYFVQNYSRKNNKELSGISPDAWELLRGYHWPGNVRELENAIERAVILTRTGVIEPDQLPPAVRRAPPATSHFVIPFGTPLEEIERRILLETLRRTGGDKNLTARLLGVAARTIYRKLDRYEDIPESEVADPEAAQSPSATPPAPAAEET
jgi:two-component system response regulator HydG